MKAFFALLILVGASLNSESAAARKSSILRADRIQISYVPPKNSAHEALFQLLKERRVLEKFKGLLSALRLPRALLLKVEGCDGESNAWYADDAVTVCYEYLADILRNAPKETTPAGVTRTDAIVGPTLEVFLHEVGHAVFDYLSVPILGREEDAADQFAAYILLQFAESDARRLIYGVAYSYNIDASQTEYQKKSFRRRARPSGAALLQRAVHGLRGRFQAVRRSRRQRISTQRKSRGLCRRVRPGDQGAEQTHRTLYRSEAGQTGASQAMVEVRCAVIGVRIVKCRNCGDASAVSSCSSTGE